MTSFIILTPRTFAYQSESAHHLSARDHVIVGLIAHSHWQLPLYFCLNMIIFHYHPHISVTLWQFVSTWWIGLNSLFSGTQNFYRFGFAWNYGAYLSVLKMIITTLVYYRCLKRGILRSSESTDTRIIKGLSQPRPYFCVYPQTYLVPFEWLRYDSASYLLI